MSPGLEQPIHIVRRTARTFGPAPQAFVDLLEASSARKKKPARTAG